MSDIIETIKGESTDLALHVELCEQRYIQLIHKFDTVDERLGRIDAMLLDIKQVISNEKSDTYKTYLGWAGFIIVALVGAITHLLTK